MPVTGTAARWEAEPDPTPQPSGASFSRASLYGGLVGDMIGEIEHRMVADGPEFGRAPIGEDGFHRLSVAAGYLGLAAGCAATVLGVAALI